MTASTFEQIAAALCEQVYRRSANEQQLQELTEQQSAEGFGTEAVAQDLSQNPSFPSFFDFDNGYYYNNITGFVGRIVEADGKAFVVFRGSDLSSDFSLGLLFSQPEPPTGPIVADPYDWADNFDLGLGTTDRTQLDDALAFHSGLPAAPCEQTVP